MLSNMTSVRASGRDALVDVLALIEGPARTGGPVGGTASALAPDVRAWVSDPDQGVAAIVDSVDGADTTREVLARLAPSELTVAAAAASERACWASARTASGDGRVDVRATRAADSRSVFRRPDELEVP